VSICVHLWKILCPNLACTDLEVKPYAAEPSIHLWAPEIFSMKGGIQTYSAFLLEALRGLQHRVCLNVVLKNDRALPPGAENRQATRFSFAGSAPRRLRNGYFVLQTIGRGLVSRPDLVIATHAHFAGLGKYLKKATGTPYWVVAHGKEVWGLESPGLRSALQEADLVLSVSGYTRDRLLIEQKLDPDRVVILPNTMDAERFHIGPKPARLLAKYGLEADQPVILTVARLDENEQYKGYDTILRSMPAIRKEIPKVRYLIVGKGRDRERIERIIAEMKLESCVTLAGYIPDDELCDHYNLCDVYAMPSKGEGFGIVYLEAMACGKPAIAGNKDGSVDALCNGELGVLVDPDNVEEICRALIGTLKATLPHPSLYDAQALRRKVIDVYGGESFQRRVSELLQTRLTFKIGADRFPVTTE
jgi:glycosyltransferase involved in cell wall biosynthesis